MNTSTIKKNKVKTLADKCVFNRIGVFIEFQKPKKKIPTSLSASNIFF